MNDPPASGQTRLVLYAPTHHDEEARRLREIRLRGIFNEMPSVITQGRTPSDTRRSQAVETALDAALIVMRGGGSTVSAERVFCNILQGYREHVASAIWRLDFIAATQGASTALRSVGAIGVNLTRVAEISTLSALIAQKTTSTAALSIELERIRHLPSPYPRWMTVAIAACTGACFSQLSGSDWGSFAISFVAVGVGQLLRSQLQAGNRAAAPVTFVSGLLSAVIACIGLRLGYSEVEPATLSASVVYLIPGLPLINGFIDVLSHRHVMIGVERIVNATYLILLLAIAIALAHTIIL